MNPTADNLVAIQNLAKSEEYKQFCELLEDTWTQTVRMKMRNNESITEQDIAKEQIYASLKDLPNQLALQFTKKPKQKKTVY